MYLTFLVPMQYCSIKHQTLLPSPVTSTPGCCFCFGPISSFFLELFLHWFPVACWAPTHLGSSSFSVLSFCLFLLFMGFSRHEYWSGLPFPSPVYHVLSELSTMTRPSWVALHGMAHSFHWVRQGCGLKIFNLIGLKIYWAWPHPSEQDPVSPSVIFSHQEASISLLFFSIRGQTDWKPQSQKKYCGKEYF